MEMRLGKTLVAIRWVETLGLANPRVLLVTPGPVFEVWEDELKLEGYPPPVILEGSLKQRCTWLDGGPGWYLTNYEGLYDVTLRSRIIRPSPIATSRWDVVILDEATQIRSPKAKRTKAAVRFLGKAWHKAVLSGLPDPEDMLDYCELFRFLQGTFMGYKTWWHAQQGLCRRSWYDWVPKVGAKEKLRAWVHANAYQLTREDAGMPDVKVFEKRHCDLPPALRRAYERAETEFALGQRETKWRPVVRTWLQQLAGGYPPEKELQSPHKLKLLTDLLTGELRREPVVVWFRFNSELDAAFAELQRLGVSCCRISGLVGRELRRERIADCRAGKTRVALVQLACGKYGLNYSWASTAIYYSNSEQNELRAQSVDRIVDVAKKGPLLIIDLVTRETVDQDIVEALSDKGLESRYFMRKINSLVLRRAKCRIR